MKYVTLLSIISNNIRGLQEYVWQTSKLTGKHTLMYMHREAHKANALPGLRKLAKTIGFTIDNGVFLLKRVYIYTLMNKMSQL